MENGEDFEFYQRIAVKSGKEPAKLTELPELSDGQFFYVHAFSILSRSRQMGMGVGGILLSEIRQYMKMYDIEDKERFTTIILAMDAAFIKAKPPQKRGS